MKRKKLRAVVCGSTFGQFYLEALKMLPEAFEPAGLLARGSQRSKKCAAYYGVDLYTDAGQLPDDIDLACVVLRSGVMGGRGTDLSLELLRRGIHVLQEQPVHHKDMAACLRAALGRGVLFQTGDLYVHLPAVRRFIACAKAMLARQEALYVDAAFASQVSYPLMHILMEALPSIRPWRVGTVSRDGGPFHVLTGALGKIPVVLRVHNEVDPGDPDNYLHLLHRITIGCAGGSLSLTDTHGPVVWRPRLHVPEDLHTFGQLAGDYPLHLSEHSTETLGPAAPASYGDILARQWPRAIARDLSLLAAMISGAAEADTGAVRALLCAGQWHEMTAALGYPVLRPGCGHQPLPVDILKAAAATIPAGDGRPGASDAPGACSPAAAGVASCTEYADGELRGIDPPAVRLFVERLDEAVFSAMLHALQARGALTDREREYGPAEIWSLSQTAPRHRHLVLRWLELLAARGYLERRGDCFCGAGVVTEDMLRERWRAVREIWDGRLGPPLVLDYLLSNVEQLPRLMSGKQQAALLLFPAGGMDYANALYRETIAARYLNKSVAEAVVRIGAAKGSAPDAGPGPGKPLRIVELGAGTGATTDQVVARLRALPGAPRVEYRFTDVSNFFLAAARERFADCPWMRFEIADIDRDLAGQGLRAASVDIVIAAGVMNNASDIAAAVDGLTRLLVPGGWALITEPVREFPEILISQAFMMTSPEDDRKNTRTTFMSVRQWRDVFHRAGAAEVLTLPGEEHPIAPLGQKLFAARKKSLLEYA